MAHSMPANPMAHSHPIPFNIDTFHPVDNDPVIHSAGPFQQNFHFSPTTSPNATFGHSAANLYNATSLGSSLNSGDFVSPPGSAFPSQVSTPQPVPENEQMFFDRPSNDMRQQAMHNFNAQRAGTLPMVNPQSYMFNTTSDQLSGPLATSTSMGQYATTMAFNPSNIVIPHQSYLEHHQWAT